MRESSMRESLKRALARRPWVRPLRAARRDWKLRHGGQPDWQELLGGDLARLRAAAEDARARGGPRVLLATSVGGQLASSIVDNLLAAALALRGADVHVLLCDAALPACMACEVGWYPEQEQFVRRGPRDDVCVGCFDPAAAAFASIGATVHRYGDLVTSADRARAGTIAAAVPFAQVDGFELEGIAVGEHALAGALRFFARGDLAGEPHGEAILRRYLEAAILSAWAVRRLLETRAWTRIVAHHGIYVPQGIVAEVARRVGVPIATWNPAYRSRTFIFSHGDTYHRTLLAEPTSAWDDVPWTAAREAQTLAYLDSRRTGREDWIWFHERPEFDVERIASAHGLDRAKPWIALLTSVFWDARLHYPQVAFRDMREWIVRTIEWFARRPDLQLVIRVHPAEVRAAMPSRQRAVDEIRRAFPTLPPNVALVPPESTASTYALVERCDAALIYSTKMGIEVASLGVPVVTAGEAWVRGKGISLDAATPEEYFALLARLPFGADQGAASVEPAVNERAARTERARRYAYHCFFRRMIPIELMEPLDGWPPYRIRLTALRDLEVGSCRGLDLVCDGILAGAEFVHRAEELEDAEVAARSAAGS